jgi:hypothetical protein
MKCFTSAATALLIYFILPAALPAGEQNNISLSFGLNQIKEETIIPKVHSGLITTLSYERVISDTSLYADAGTSLSYSRINTAYESDNESACVAGSIHGRCLFPVAQNETMQAALGPELFLDGSWNTYPAWDESHYYWATVCGPAVSGRFSWKIRQHQTIICSASFLLCSLVSRPESERLYKIADYSARGTLGSLFSGMEFTLPDQTMRTAVCIEFRNKLNNTISESLFYAYRFESVSNATSEPYKNNTHQIGVSLWF